MLFSSRLDGILVGYGKLFLKSPRGCFLNEEAYIHLDVASDFWLFRPSVGSQLSGVIHKKSPTHVACLVHGVFNVPCYKPEDSPDDEWCGDRVRLNQVVSFIVVKTDYSQRRVPFILGSLIESSVDERKMARPEESVTANVEEVPESSWKSVVGGGKASIGATNNNDHQNGVDSGIDNVGRKSKNKRKREEEEATQPPKKKKREAAAKVSDKRSEDKEDKDQEELQSSLLARLNEKFEKKKKKQHTSDVDETVQSQESPRKRKKKKSSTKEEPEEEEESRRLLQESLLNSVYQGGQSKKKKKTKEASDRVSVLSSAEKKRSPKKKSEETFPKPELLDLLESTIEPESPAFTSTKTPSTSTPLAPGTGSKKKKKKQKEDKVKIQNLLIENMVAKMQRSKGKKK